MQQSGKEKSETLYPFWEKFTNVSTNWKTKNTIKANYYNINDGRMLYLLFKHSLSSRKYSQFLLCNCKRGDAARGYDNLWGLNIHKEHADLHNQLLWIWRQNKEKYWYKVSSMVLRLTVTLLINKPLYSAFRNIS